MREVLARLWVSVCMPLLHYRIKLDHTLSLLSLYVSHGKSFSLSPRPLLKKRLIAGYSKGETAVHGCHCSRDMAVRMRDVMARPGRGLV